MLDARNAMQTTAALPAASRDRRGAAAPAASDVGAGATNPANDPALAVPAARAETTPAAPGDSGAASGQPAESGAPAAPIN